MARERPVVKCELLSDIISNVIPEEKEVCPVPSSERETVAIPGICWDPR